MKPGDCVIWIYSPKRSILKGLRLQRIPGEIVRIHRQKIRIRVWMWGRLRLVNVYPENVLCMDEDYEPRIPQISSVQSVVQTEKMHERN